MCDDKEDFLSSEEVAELGIKEHARILTSDIPFSEEVRKMCECNTCQHYGRVWSCPPAIGTYEECVDRCLSYKSIWVFSICYQLEDSFDFEGMMKGMNNFRQTCEKLHHICKEKGLRHQVLTAGSCNRCKQCTYPDSPCRFPDLMIPALEGHGILVGELAKKGNLQYNNGPNTMTYFGAVLL